MVETPPQKEAQFQRKREKNFFLDQPVLQDCEEQDLEHQLKTPVVKLCFNQTLDTAEEF